MSGCMLPALRSDETSDPEQYTDDVTSQRLLTITAWSLVASVPLPTVTCASWEFPVIPLSTFCIHRQPSSIVHRSLLLHDLAAITVIIVYSST
jgi:hypothetical protein